MTYMLSLVSSILSNRTCRTASGFEFTMVKGQVMTTARLLLTVYEMFGPFG